MFYEPLKHALLLTTTIKIRRGKRWEETRTIRKRNQRNRRKRNQSRKLQQIRNPVSDSLPYRRNRFTLVNLKKETP